MEIKVEIEDSLLDKINKSDLDLPSENNEIDSFKCDICSLSFPSKNLLEIHNYVFKGKKTFQLRRLLQTF